MNNELVEVEGRGRQPNRRVGDQNSEIDPSESDSETRRPHSNPWSTGSSLEAFLQETRAPAKVETVAQLCRYNTQVTSMQDTCFLRRGRHSSSPRNGSTGTGSSLRFLFYHCQKTAQSPHFLTQKPVSWGRSINWDKVRRCFCVRPIFFSLV